MRKIETFHEEVTIVPNMDPRKINMLFIGKPYMPNLRKKYDWQDLIPVVDEDGIIQDVMFDFEAKQTELKKIPIRDLDYDESEDVMVVVH